jgi:hypothetical protein
MSNRLPTVLCYIIYIWSCTSPTCICEHITQVIGDQFVFHLVHMKIESCCILLFSRIGTPSLFNEIFLIDCSRVSLACVRTDLTQFVCAWLYIESYKICLTRPHYSVQIMQIKSNYFKRKGKNVWSIKADVH